jgi:hypothetical protein
MNGSIRRPGLTDVLSRIAAHPGAGVYRLRRRESRRAHQNPQGIDADQRALKSTTNDAPLRPTPDADSRRLMISGGSAGGYTTLCALTPKDDKVFSAGASYYGVSDLEALARDTHKFESSYLDWLLPH